MNINRTISIGLAISLAAFLAGCSSTTPTDSSASVASPTAAASAPAAASALPTPAPVDTASLTCADADMAAAHIVTDVHYAAINVGTTNDTTPTFADLAQNLAVVQAMAPQCAAGATAQLDALGQAATAAASAYRGGADAAVVATDKQVLQDLKTAGVAAWSAMGMDAAAWDNTLRFTH